MSILEFLTGFIPVFENPLWDWLAGGILLTASGSIAYAIGGQLGYGGRIGWFLWLFTAFMVYGAIACVIRAIMWLIALPWWVWAIAGAAILSGIIVAIVLTVRSKRIKAQ